MSGLFQMLLYVQHVLLCDWLHFIISSAVLRCLQDLDRFLELLALFLTDTLPEMPLNKVQDKEARQGNNVMLPIKAWLLAIQVVCEHHGVCNYNCSPLFKAGAAVLHCTLVCWGYCHWTNRCLLLTYNPFFNQHYYWVLVKSGPIVVHILGTCILLYFLFNGTLNFYSKILYSTMCIGQL